MLHPEQVSPEETRLDESRLDGLSPAERRVADFLVRSGAEGLVLSAAAIATRLGVSDATVVRTAKAMGFAGLGELRRALAERGADPALTERLRRTLDESSSDRLLDAGIANTVSGLHAMRERVTPERFQQTVDVLGSRDRVVWRGVGPSAALADYGRIMCERVGRRSSAMVHTGTSFADELLTLASTDAVAVFAYGKPQVHVSVLLDRAEAVGAPVVLITDVTDRRLADRVDAVVNCGRGAPGLFASHAATLVVVEALVLGLAARDSAHAQQSLSTLNDLRASLAGRRVDVDFV